MLLLNEPAPWFTARSTVNPNFQIHTVAGRYVVLCFIGSASAAPSGRVLHDIEHHRDRFNGDNAVFFGVSIDRDDERLGRIQQTWPAIIYFWDFDLEVSRLYGVASPAGATYRPLTIILDPRLRIAAVLPINDRGETHVAEILAVLDGLPPIKTLNGFAPVLAVPEVFEADLCRNLIKLYEQHGGYDSGFMRDVDGKTVAIVDHKHKHRSDYSLTQPGIIRALQIRLYRRLIPEIKKAFQFNVTRIERHVVCCYDAAIGGYFRPHRDNTTKGTAHRRFAVTINLNADEYQGGDLRFPEFGPRLYRATTGGAIVFSCSLLHEAAPITQGNVMRTCRSCTRTRRPRCEIRTCRSSPTAPPDSRAIEPEPHIERSAFGRL